MQCHASYILSHYVLAWCLSGAVAFAEDTAAPPPASHTLEQLIDGMYALDRAFDPAHTCVWIRFRDDQTMLDRKGQVDPKAQSWVDVEYARKGEMVYNHITQKLPSEMSPFQEWITWDGKICVHRREDGVSIYPDVLPQAYTYYRYTDRLFVDCCRLIHWKSPSGIRDAYAYDRPSHPFMLPEILVENKSHYTVRPIQEQVDGVWCHVVDWPHRDRLYVDVAHGYVALRRVVFYHNDVPGAEFFNREVFEASPGLWLPRAQEVHRYYHPYSAAHLVGRVERINRSRLIDVRFAPLDDAEFTVPIAEGERLLVNDNVRKLQYWHYPNNDNPLPAVIADALSIRSVSGRGNFGVSRQMVLLTNATIIGTLTLLWMIRPWRLGFSRRRG